MNLLVDENITGWQQWLQPLGNVTAMSGRAINPSHLKNIDALIVRSITQVNEVLLANADQLTFVGTATAGVDHIDEALLAERNIAFSSAPGCNANSVVEYVLAGIANCPNVLERLLAGGTVGIVGYGHVGQGLAARLRALGVACCIYDPWQNLDGLPDAGSLEQVLACEVVSLHPNLHHDEPWPSHHVLNSASLSALQSNVVLINASRGAVIDNTALLQWMEANPRASVILDAWEGEPTVNRALAQRVLIGTPHIAGYSLDAKLAATVHMARQLAQHFDCAPPLADHQNGAPLLHLRDGEPVVMLRQLLEMRYDISADHQRFQQQCLALPDVDERALAFDALRKHYPIRRELAGSPVSVESDAGTELATALAVNVIENVVGKS